MSLKKIISLLTFFSIVAVNGQTTLTAKQAVFYALENNFSIQIAEQQTSITQKNNTWGEAGLYPTVSLNVGFNNGIQDNTNNPFTFTPGIILSQGFSPSLSANWNIFSGFAVRIAKDRLEQLEQQSQGNAIVIIETTIQDVLKAYYTAQLQKQRMELFNTLKDYSKKRYKYYEIKDKYAKSNSLELLQFRNQFLTDSSNYVLQQISYNNAVRNLLFLMNPTEESPVESFPVLTDQLQNDFPVFELSQLKEDIRSNNQNLKNQYIALELQKTNTSFQKSFLYPTLSFQAGVTPSYNWLRDIKNDQLNINTQVLSYYGNLNLRYTVFNNYKTKRAVEVSRIQEEIAQLNVESMEKSMDNAIINMMELYNLRLQLLSISEENLQYATKAYELAKSRFETGTLSSMDLSTFQNNYQNTLILHYENQFNLLDTYLEIYKMTGKLGLEYKKN